MKANEAPEKIYMTPSFGEPDNVLLASFSKSHLDFHRDIEYTRTDCAKKRFIAEAKTFLSEIHRVCDITDENGYRIELRDLQARFENYINGKLL